MSEPDSEPNRTRAEELPPDPPALGSRPLLEKYESGLIAALVGLIAAGNLLPRILPDPPPEELRVERAAENLGLPPVDWSSPPEPRPVPSRDLNAVSNYDLISLPGIGPALAAAVTDYRDRNGPFSTFEDLDEVPGIGPRKLELLRAYLHVESASASIETDSPEALARAAPATASEEPSRAMSEPRADSPDSSERPEIVAAEDGSIDLNSATLSDLTSIPGIGEVFADRILEHRARHGPFRSWSEVDAVPGIGEKRLENIRRHATLR